MVKEEVGGIVGDVEEISITESSESSAVEMGVAEEDEAAMLVRFVGLSGVTSRVGSEARVSLSAASTVAFVEDEG